MAVVFVVQKTSVYLACDCNWWLGTLPHGTLHLSLVGQLKNVEEHDILLLQLLIMLLIVDL